MPDKQNVLPFRQRDPFSYSDKDMLQVMEEDWNRSEDHYNTQFEDMLADWKRIILIHDKDEEVTAGEQGTSEPQSSGRSCLKGTALYEHYTTFVSMVMAALFPDDAEWLHARPTSVFTKEDLPTQLNNIEAYRQYRLWQLSSERMKFRENFEGFIRQGVGYYWSFLLYSYETRGAMIEAPEPDAATGIKRYMDKMRRVIKRSKSRRGRPDPDEGWMWNPRYYENTSASTLNTFNTRPDPRGGRDFNRHTFLEDEYRANWFDLYEGEYDEKENPQGQYFNLDELAELYPKDDGTQTSEEEKREEIGEHPADAAQNPEGSESKIRFRDTVILRRYWTPFGVVTADRNFKVIVQKRRYTKMPLYVCRYSFDPTKFEAQSLTRVMRDSDSEVDFLMNMQLDDASTGVDGIPVQDTTRVNPESQGATIVHGKTVKVDGPIDGAFDIISTRGVTQQLWMIRQYVRSNEMPGISGITENMAGRMFSSRRLATEIQAVQQGGANRGGQWVQSVQDDILTPLMNDFNELESARMQNEYLDFIVRGEDEGLVAEFPITQEFVRRIAGLCRFEAQGNKFANQKEMKRAGIINFLNTFGMNPNSAQFLNWRNLTAYGARVLAECPDPEQLLMPDIGAQISIPPELENELILERGRNLEPQFLDDDKEHLEVHQAAMARAEIDVMLPENDIDSEGIERLMLHLKKTMAKLAAKQQQTAQPGPVSPTLPGQENSQNTAGTQMANMNNAEPAGVGPPTNQEV